MDPSRSALGRTRSSSDQFTTRHSPTVCKAGVKSEISGSVVATIAITVLRIGTQRPIVSTSRKQISSLREITLFLLAATRVTQSEAGALRTQTQGDQQQRAAAGNGCH